MRCIRFIVTLLLIVGALNWGLVGFFKYDLIADIFGGQASTWARIIFSLIGLAGLYKILFLWGRCSCCICGGKHKGHDSDRQDKDQ